MLIYSDSNMELYLCQGWVRGAEFSKYYGRRDIMELT